MDAEAMKFVQDKISSHVPEHVANKIFGYMLIHVSHQELIRLAYGPDNLIRDLVQEIKNTYLVASPSPSRIASSPPISPTTNHHNPLANPSLQCNPFSRGPLTGFRWAGPYLDHQFVLYQQMIDLSIDQMPYDESLRFSSMENPLVPSRQRVSGFPNHYYNSQENGFTKFAKSCRYFARGNCRHGSNCKFLHPMGRSFPIGDDQPFSPGSLERLEMEITDLLISRRGNPVSIASLPTLYYEKYGKTLQAEGYLTESQRHGKAGYSLTKLLARLTNSFRLIERPHGQHVVVLADNASPYIEFRGERNDPGPIVSGSRHIYMTFPAESSFTEEDVFNYFSEFGQVQEVRIPCQQKRMFGFVTFASAEIVKTILSTETAHLICGARVLVKPYREKSKNMERKSQERFDHATHYSHPVTFGPEFQDSLKSSRLFERPLMEEHAQALEYEAIRLSRFHLTNQPTNSSSQSCLGYSMAAVNLSKDQGQFPSIERVNHLSLKSSSSSSNNSMFPVDNFADEESNQGLNLPDSLFASATPSSISTVI